MAKKTFRESMKAVPEVLALMELADVTGLRRFLLDDMSRPLYCVGCGGSYSSAVYTAMLYSACKGMAKAVTPLMLASVSDDVLRQAKMLVFTVSGRGVDVEYAIQRMAAVNPDGLGCLSRSAEVKKVPAHNLFTHLWPGADGFIATLSPFAMHALVHQVFASDKQLLSRLDLSSEECYRFVNKAGETLCKPYREIPNYTVLYAGWGEPVAYDLESKLVEAGYANVQFCDYRNFTHGRFMHLSNHLGSTALVLLVTPREREFIHDFFFNGKDRGGKPLFPDHLQLITIETELDCPLASIDLLRKASVLFTDIGDSYGYDPCQPKNPGKIDKQTPRSFRYKGLSKMGCLSV